jgi:hypothetical protein
MRQPPCMVQEVEACITAPIMILSSVHFWLSFTSNIGYTKIT